MAKKIFKGVKHLARGVVGSIIGKKLFGGGKKKTAAPVEGQPITAPLTADQEYEAKHGRKRPKATALGTILGAADAGKLGQ